MAVLYSLVLVLVLVSEEAVTKVIGMLLHQCAMSNVHEGFYLCSEGVPRSARSSTSKALVFTY
jgi:hypothetical protein